MSAATFADAAGTWLERTGRLRDLVRQHVVAETLSGHLEPPRRRLDVLDVGAGQGTQALRLAAHGHAVVAVEPDGRMREAFAAAASEAGSLGALGPVEVLPASLDDLSAAAGGRRFDVVLCHGVLMYLADPAPAVAVLVERLRPGGVLSLVVRNADALALRPALRGDWTGALAGFAAAETDRRYVNELGVPARADRLDDLTGLLDRAGVRREGWYGVRCLSDAAAVEALPPSDPDERSALLVAELRAARTDPYRRLGALLHVVGRTAATEDAEVRLDHLPYDSDVVRGLEADVQREYVVRYGGPDTAPVDASEFAPPTGVLLVARIGGEPVASGGFRRVDERTAEVKRMYVARAHRGRGLGRRVLAELEHRARAAGYERVVLETGLAQPEALGLYRSSGYAPLPGFGHYRDSPSSRAFVKAL